MSSPFLAEIRIFACNFAPTGWAQCNGQILPLSQNTALFSLLGTMYGGDGKSTFALPDMQGNVAIEQGQGSGLSQYFIGQEGGTETITLLETELPNHTHFAKAIAPPTANQDDASANVMLAQVTGANIYTTSNNTGLLAQQMLAPVGGSLPHNNLMPYLVLNYCIAMQGVFPARP
jgi:microcystin-dependent protein